MEYIIEQIKTNTGIDNIIIINTLITFVLTFTVLFIKKVFKILLHKFTNIQNHYKSNKTVKFIFTILYFILILIIWRKQLYSINTFLGLISAGLAITLREPIINIAGWLFIILRKPFTLGDRIEISEKSGDVIDIRVFQFTILEIGNWVDADQSTGRIIHIPNAEIFNNTIANYYKGFQYIWNEIPVLITFESNWEKAKKLLLEISKNHSEHLSESAKKRIQESAKKYMIYYNNLTPTVYTKVNEYGVLLTIRFLSEPRTRRNSEQILWEEILKEFSKCDDIDFAYPTQRFYNNLKEGKRIHTN